MLNPVLPAPRSRRIQTARNVVDVILNARSAADLRLYEWEDRGKAPSGKTKWYDTDTKKTRYQISKPGTGRGGKKKEGEPGADKPPGEAGAGAGGKQKKTPTPRKPKVDHNEVGDRIEKMLSGEFSDEDFAKLKPTLMRMTGKQLDEVKKRFSVKGGKAKADVAGRISGHVEGKRKPARELAPIDTVTDGFRQIETPMIQPGTEKAVRNDLEAEEYSAGVHRRRLESIDAHSRWGASLGMQNERKEVAKKLAKSEANIAKLKKQLEQKQQERQAVEQPAQPAPEAAPTASPASVAGEHLRSGDVASALAVLSRLPHKDLEKAAEEIGFGGIYNTKTKKELMARLERMALHVTGAARKAQKQAEGESESRAKTEQLSRWHAREKEVRAAYENPSEQEIARVERDVRLHPAANLARESYDELIKDGFKPGEAAEALRHMNGHLSGKWRGLDVEKGAVRKAAEDGRDKTRSRLKFGQEQTRNLISEALAAGRQVPPEVLADYPDLAQKPQPAEAAAPAPKKPARKPRAVKQPAAAPTPAPTPAPAPAPAPQQQSPDGQRTREGLGQATVGRSGRLHQSLADAGIKSSSVARQAIADLEDVVSGRKTHKDLEKESTQLKRLARTAPTASDRQRAEERLQAIAWVGDESYASPSLRGEYHGNLADEIREMREANSANARKRLGGEQQGLFDSPQPQQPQPAAAPPANRTPLRSDVRSAAERKRAARAAHANRLRSQGILNARNPVDVVLHARSPQQARPLLYAWLRTASKRNPGKTVWVNSNNPKDRRYQEAMPKQRATQSVESLPPQDHLQQILEAPYRVADYYLTSLQTRLRRMRPGALAALRMQFDKEG